MSTITPAVKQVLQARRDSTLMKIDMALLGKQLDSQKETGESINAMIREIADVQQQINRGHIDVRV